MEKDKLHPKFSNYLSDKKKRAQRVNQMGRKNMMQSSE
jgi:hypothetical protein